MTETSSAPSAISHVLEGAARDLGGFSVRRILPSLAKRTLGPFVFFDHLGPAEFAPGNGVDVRPHPHVNLATVSYLLEGEITHRDSLGYHQSITPGAVNWMTAGHGIVHSERTGPEFRASGGKLHAVQLWAALPKEHEETDPSFTHHPADSLPALQRPGVSGRVLAGTFLDVTAPTQVFSRLFYVDLNLTQGATLEVPADYEERGLFLLTGELTASGTPVEQHKLTLLREGTSVTLRAESDVRLLALGGDRLDGERHIFWNFVSSSKERIEKAKNDWREGRFPQVPGETEFIPLPE
jgi:redox-sensitive bicupin YhaK (pirin superfamily)